MRILKPVGEVLEFDGKERHLLFNVNVIDQLQEDYDNDIVSIINEIFELEDKEKKKKAYAMLAHMLTVVLNEDVRLHNKYNPDDRWEDLSEEYIRTEILSNSTSKLISALMLLSFNGTMPKSDDTSPNEMSEQTKK
jgi:hypothetical protein